MRKFIFIGLGGSGGKTLRYLRSDLNRWLDQIGWTGGFPLGWQLLQIDTPSQQDGQEITDVEMLPTDSYVGLVGNGISFENVSTQLTAGARGTEGWQDLASWRVNPTFLRVPITMGAGQYRAVGRSIGLAYAEQILQAIRRAEKRLMQAEASAQLAEIATLVGGGASTAVNNDPVAVVVSSLAGGSGAGLLMDTCDLLRQVGGSWGDHSFGILYTADVFSQVGSGGGGIQPNTLAALSEVLNGHWLSPTKENPTGRINPILSAAGAAIPVSRSGPAYPFLVGASNTKGVSFGDQKSVYKMMGRALRSWTIDRTVQDKLIAYTITNWDSQAKSNVVHADVLLQHHEPVFEAYGFSEVNLGTELFEQYASERLAKLAADWLHDAHTIRARRIDPNEARQPNEIIDEFAEHLLPGFLALAKLDEKGPDRNDVIDAIRPADFDEQYLSTSDQLFEQVVAGVPSRGINREEWLQQIQGFIGQFTEQFIVEGENGIRVEARRWSEEQPDRTLEALTRTIADGGLTVATAVLDKVIRESNDTVNDLVAEAAQYDPLTSGSAVAGAIAAKLNISGRIPPSNIAVREAVEAGFGAAAYFQVEARRRRIGADVLREFTKNFLRPLRLSVNAACVDLNLKGYEGEGLVPAVVPLWPDGAVPTRLEPPKNEKLVIPTGSFRSQFESLIQMGFDDAGLDEALSHAREEIINGFFLEDTTVSRRDDHRAIRKNQKWVIDPNLIIGGNGTPTAASFSLSFAPADLLGRAVAWLNRPGTAFQRLLGSDLRSFLNDDPGVDPVLLNERRSNFRAALKAALDSAEPLVEIDQALRSLFHPGDSKPNAKPGIIPLRDHPVEADVREILAAARDGAVGEVDEILTTEAHVTSIPISSTLGAAHDPLIFESISAPIISSWAAVANSPGAMNFWLNRRARPISEFIPASQQLILSMVRGWFTGLMLGRIDRQSLRIVRSSGEIVGFPSTLLTPVDREGIDLLPAVLESLGLAYIQVAQLHSTSPLDAYSELRDLGAEASGGRNFREYDGYTALNSALRVWVREGSFGDRTLATPFLERDGLTQTSTPADRVAVASRLLNERLDAYRKDFDNFSSSVRRDANHLGPDHGLWTGMYDHIERALRQLREAFDENKSISAGVW